MKIEDIKYNSFGKFYNDMLPTGYLGNKMDGFIYRGESTKRYKLVPSALRYENRDKLWAKGTKPIANQSEWEYWQVHAEYMLLRDFYKIANYSGLKVPYVKLIQSNYIDIFPSEFMLKDDNYKWISDDLIELAALAQHYGVLTRLLDWTSNINVALYFASLGSCKRKLTDKWENDDFIIIWALNSYYIQFLQKTVDRIPLNFVVPSYYDNPNLNAQKGILSYWEVQVDSSLNPNNLFSPAMVNRKPLDELLKSYCDNGNDENIVLLYKFQIPVSDCVDMFKFISKMGYNASKLFPGYYGVAKQINENFMLNQIVNSK